MEQAIRRDFSRSKRSGQALIVAVLLMLFAAVLSATFVAVVSQNLKQTGTNSEESEVQRALQAGLRYARLQISNNGLSWRPKNDAPPPQPDDSTFSFYYDGIDRARNWATTNVAANDARFHSDGFVRFPDPRSTISSETLPFMLKVERIENGDADNINNARSGDLRISVIGRSSRNFNMWAERVIYQEGAARNPLTSTLRSVSNWDFENRVVPWARIARVSGTTLTLKDGAGEFPVGGNIYVLIGDTTSSRGVRGGVVESYSSSTRSRAISLSIDGSTTTISRATSSRKRYRLLGSGPTTNVSIKRLIIVC